MAGRRAHLDSGEIPESVSIRYAGGRDAVALARLAQLDSRPLPAGPLLVAEVEGEIVAALPLAGGPAIANPFRFTAELVFLLSVRAKQLRRTEGRFRRSTARRARPFGGAAVTGGER